jgi:hypothetical protein
MLRSRHLLVSWMFHLSQFRVNYLRYSIRHVWSRGSRTPRRRFLVRFRLERSDMAVGGNFFKLRRRRYCYLSVTFHLCLFQNCLWKSRVVGWTSMVYIAGYSRFSKIRKMKDVYLWAQTTFTNRGQAHCFASRTPTLDLWLEVAKSRKLVIEGFVKIPKFYPLSPILGQCP